MSKIVKSRGLGEEVRCRIGEFSLLVLFMKGDLSGGGLISEISGKLFCVKLE